MQEAAPALLSAARAAGEAIGNAATALSEISVRLVPATGLVADGDQAEKLMSAAARATSQATVTENTALSCERMV